MDWGPVVFIAPILLFAFLNGANDAGTLAASVVSSRAVTPRAAVVAAALG